MGQTPTNYWSYLGIDELLALQGGLGRDESEIDNDEVLFIVAHQIDELWLKLVLRELVVVRDRLARDPVPETSLAAAVAGLRRTSLLFSLLAGHFSLLETLSTREYLAFRDKLRPASGFQSGQLREIEILMGLDESARIGIGATGYLDALRNPDGSASPGLERVLARLRDRPSLGEAVRAWLYRTPIDGSRPSDPDDEPRTTAFVSGYLAALEREISAQAALAARWSEDEADRARLAARFERELEGGRRFLSAVDVEAEQRPQVARARAALVFIESYRELPLLAWPRQLIDALVELEQSFLIFRQRHARMVERVIGRRVGTGGSDGVDYLDQTALRYRIFPDVWAVRTVLVKASALPPLRHASAYGFVAGAG